MMNKTANPEDYSNIFRNLSAQISEKKLRRYSADEIRRLNNNSEENFDRECNICGISSNLLPVEDSFICENCLSFQEISNELIKNDAVFMVTNKKENDTVLPLFDYSGESLFLSTVKAET
ncbi:MAG: hypothetical protein GX154_12860, partial [Clostridiales bacterium]|nr:hypothetical protein [Clostridiales bacterium]